MALLVCLLPDFVGSLSDGTRHALLYQFFKIGSLAVTPIFLAKFVIFLVLLFSISHLVQKLLFTRLLQHLHIADSLKFALGRFATYLLMIGGLFVGLQSLGVNLSSLVVFGGAVGVGVGLGLQNVVSNFVAGLILLIEQPIRLGDRVELKSTIGDVIKIAARSTWIRTNDNVVMIVPNNEFINNSVTNWTANDPNVRIRVAVGVGYASDPEVVRGLLLAAADAHPDVLKDPKPIVFFMEYGDNSINFELMVWTGTLTHRPAKLRSDLLFALFKTFGEHGIELPFPQRDLHIRSSDVALFAPQVPPKQVPGGAPLRSPRATGVLPARAGQKWSREEDDELRELFRNKLPLREIAKQFQRKPGGVAARLVRLQLVSSRDEARRLLRQ